MLGFLITATLFWLAIVLVVRDDNLSWWDPIPRLLLATAVFLALYLGFLLFLELSEPAAFFVALAGFVLIIFHYLWNNYGGMGLAKTLAILTVFILLEITWMLFRFALI